jgi:tetratricopeptide (TPR) repeat protein
MNRRDFIFRIHGFLFLALLTAAVVGCQPKEVTRAKIYIQNHEWDWAIVQLEDAVKNYPDNPEAHFLLGQVYGNKWRFKKMAQHFEQSLALSEKFKALIAGERERHWVEQINAGIIAIDKQEYDRAETFFNAAIVIDPSKIEAQKKLALLYLKTNRLEQALLLYENMAATNSMDLQTLISMANLYSTQGKYEDAISLLKRILEMEPGHRDALTNLALAYEATGKPAEAEAAFEQAVTAHPLDAELIFLYAEHHYKRGSYEKAIQLFERVLELRPQDFEATANIGSAYFGLAENVRKQLQIANDGAYSADEIKKMQARAIADYKNSIPYLKKAIELRPDQPDLWRNLGVAYLNTGERKLGEEAFLKAEELRLNSPPE